MNLNSFDRSKKRKKIDKVKEPWLLKEELKSIRISFRERVKIGDKLKIRSKSFTVKIPENLLLEEFVTKVKDRFRA